MKPKTFDVIVIGAGSGLIISSAASEMGLKVALIEKGPMGGTCLNRGCIPSKMLIHHADIAELIHGAKKFGMEANLLSVDFASIIRETSKTVDEDARHIEQTIREDKNITLYKTHCTFVSHKTLQAGNEIITSPKIFIVAGTRPSVPDIKGLKDVPYVTSDGCLRLKKQPRSITFIGGGYIAAELAHFFGSLGSKVTIIHTGDVLLNREDQEVAKRFTRLFSKKHTVYLHAKADEVRQRGKMVEIAMSQKNTHKIIRTELLAITTGRVPNTDLLAVDKSGILTNKKGFIETNGYLESNVKGVWALGDIAGKYMFKHSANLEAQYAVHNGFSNEKAKVDYVAMPHAVFSSPQIAGVGFTEEELKEKRIPYRIGRYDYVNSGMGMAIKDIHGFVKLLVHKKTRKILGCHIMGTDASTLIHEVVVAMKAGNGTIENITKAVHIHPALSEVIQRAALNIE